MKALHGVSTERGHDASQFGLLAIGALVVVAVLIYNRVQESRAKRDAERTFRSGHDDVLLHPPAVPQSAEAGSGRPEDAPPEACVNVKPDGDAVRATFD